MRRFLPWLTMALLVVMALTWLLTSSFPLIDKSQVLSSAALEPVSAGHELIQTIKAPTDRISRIDLVLGKPNRGAKGDVRIQLVEVNVTEDGGKISAGDVLREETLDTGSFDYTVRESFEFPQVDVEPGKTYGVRLTSDDPEDAAVVPGGWTVDNYNGGTLYVDGKATPEDLYFAIYHDGGTGELISRMKPWRPFPLNQTVVIAGLFLAGAASFGWLLWIVASSKGVGRAEGEERQG